MANPDGRPARHQRSAFRRRSRCVSGAGEAEARAALAACGGQVKVALVMLGARVDAAEAERRLEAAQGHLRAALPGAPPGDGVRPLQPRP